jgi:1,4-dihydroxy-2-naphthoate octaprenyltransferase
MQPWKDALALMRIPFSVFLMPVFWLALASIPSGEWHWQEAVWVFIVLHFLLFPASNGYNSLIDKDDTPVGGLRKPPQVNMQLQILVLVFDLLAIGFGFALNVFFGFFVSVYWLVSRAYSSPQIRLKKYPWVSWLVVALFQGGWTVMMVWAGLMGREIPLEEMGLWRWPLIASFFLAGSYPLTQVYQHESDSRRGDLTLSRILGIKGTFVFAQIWMVVGAALLVFSMIAENAIEPLFLVAAASIPSFLYFFLWTRRVWIDQQQADFDNTMRYNIISSLSLSVGFILWVFVKVFDVSLHLHPNF